MHPSLAGRAVWLGQQDVALGLSLKERTWLSLEPGSRRSKRPRALAAAHRAGRLRQLNLDRVLC